MADRFEKKFDAGEKRPVLGDLCLVQPQNRRLVVVLDAYLPDSFRIYIPRLFSRHCNRQAFPAAVRNVEPQKILAVILDRVPTWRPCR